jgi:hypothetical protein
METDIQAQKLSFIQEFLRINDEAIIQKLSVFLQKEKSKKIQNNLKVLSQEDIILKLNKSENDIVQGKLISQTEIKDYFNLK